MLSNLLDRLRGPVVKVKWNVGELEHRTVMRLVESLAAYFLKFGLGIVHINNHLDSIDYFARESADFYHHAGTTRMSDTPSSGIVDKECRVHGIENLYVNGSSVMPTSGAANPTFTIIALSIRLSGHLKSQFGLR
jgi:choline dehydrogenase-like flavoprotein